MLTKSCPLPSTICPSWPCIVVSSTCLTVCLRCICASGVQVDGVYSGLLVGTFRIKNGLAQYVLLELLGFLHDGNSVVPQLKPNNFPDQGNEPPLFVDRFGGSSA